jgi:hypothetical protein
MLNHLWAGAKRSAAREVHPTSRSQLTLDTTRREVYACRDRSPRYVGDARHAAGTRQRCVGGNSPAWDRSYPVGARSTPWGRGYTLWRGQVTPCTPVGTGHTLLGQVTPAGERPPLPGTQLTSPWEGGSPRVGKSPYGDRSRPRWGQVTL